jgi:hypothetical protein
MEQIKKYIIALTSLYVIVPNPFFSSVDNPVR